MASNSSGESLADRHLRNNHFVEINKLGYTRFIALTPARNSLIEQIVNNLEDSLEHCLR